MELLDTEEENSDEPAEAEVRLIQYSIYTKSSVCLSTHM